MLNGEKIKDLARERGKTVAVLADEIGVSTAMMSFIMNNKRDTTVSVALRIARALGVSLEEIC